MGSRMKMFYPYPGKRNPQNVDKVSFKISKEFKLKDSVRETANVKVTPCLFEMSLVFTCLKESNFNETHCMEEVQKFNSCYINARNEIKKMSERRKNPTKSFVSDNLIDCEVNELLKKYKTK